MECDLGQTEFTPPGCISLLNITEPVLGMYSALLKCLGFTQYKSNDTRTSEYRSIKYKKMNTSPHETYGLPIRIPLVSKKHP